MHFQCYDGVKETYDLILTVGGQISYWNMRVLMPGSKLEHCGHDVLPCNTHKTFEWLQQQKLTETVLWHQPQRIPIWQVLLNLLNFTYSFKMIVEGYNAIMKKHYA